MDRYREVIYTDPANQPAILALTEHAISEGDFSAAAALASIALRLNPNSAEAGRLLVAAYASDENYDQAIAQADALAALRSTKVLGTYLLGRIYRLQDNLNAAVIKLQETLELEPRVTEALRILALTIQERDGIEAALSVLQDHKDRYPDHVHALELLGQFTADAGQMEEARSWFDAAIEMDPGRATTYMLLGDLELTGGETEKALAVYERGLQQNNRNVPLMLRMGQVSEVSGDYEAAAEYYQTALTLADIPSAQNNLAMLYADHLRTDGNLQNALSLMRAHADSDNAAMLDTLGWVYFRLGEYRSALRYLRRAVELAGEENPAISFHAGMAFAHNEQPRRATEFLTKALDSDVEFVGVEEAREMLAKLTTEPATADAGT